MAGPSPGARQALTLPQELWDKALKYLTNNLTHPANLLNFALASKQHAMHADQARFHKIHLKFESQDSLEENLRRLDKDLSRDGPEFLYPSPPTNHQADIPLNGPTRHRHVRYIRISQDQSVLAPAPTPAPAPAPEVQIPQENLPAPDDSPVVQNDLEAQVISPATDGDQEVQGDDGIDDDRSVTDDSVNSDFVDSDMVHHDWDGLQDTDDEENTLERFNQLAINGDRGYSTGPPEHYDFFASNRERFPDFHSRGRPLSPEEDQKLENCWSWVVEFVSRFNGVTDLIWDCVDRMPSGLVSHLENARIRLHHLTLSLPSLIITRHAPQVIDGDDLKIAKSPSLHSLTAWCGFDYARDLVDYTEDAIKLMVAGEAPNLKHVRVERGYSYRSGAPAPIFTGFSHGTAVTPCQLRSFSLTGNPLIEGPDFSAWRPLASFQLLSKLELYNFHVWDIEDLTELAKNDRLPCLRDLSLELRNRGDHTYISPLGYIEDTISFDISVAKLLSFLRGLTRLYLTGPVTGRALYAVARYLRRLEDLTYRVEVGSFRFRDKFDHCPPLSCQIQSLVVLSRLRVLNIAIERESGSAYEVDCYRAIGKLPALEELSLQFEVNPVHPHFCSRSDDESETTKALKNSAMDRTLAEKIFHLLRGNRVHKKFTTHLYFAEHCLWNRQEGYSREFGYYFESAQLQVAKEWMCTYLPKLDSQEGENGLWPSDGEYRVVEIDRRERLKDMKDRRDLACLANNSQIRKFKKIWDAAWPSEEEKAGSGEKKKHWSRNWESLPLQMDLSKSYPGPSPSVWVEWLEGMDMESYETEGT